MLINKNSKTLIWDNIPEWAIYSLEYGIEEDLFLTDEDKKIDNQFIGEKFFPKPDMPCQWIGNHTRSSTVFLHSENRARLIRSGSVTYKSEKYEKDNIERIQCHSGKLSWDLDCRTLGFA